MRMEAIKTIIINNKKTLEGLQMKSLQEFMKDHDIKTIKEARYALEDGEFLSSTDLTTQEAEDLWYQASEDNFRR